MAGGTNKPGGNGKSPPPDEAALSARLQRLGDKLSKLRKSEHSRTSQNGEREDRAASASAMARGFRLSSELVAGVVVGAVIGWGLDRWLSTTPWGLIVFVLLGFAAGVLNVMRSAGVGQGDSTSGPPR